MKIRIILFGTLRKDFPTHDFEVDLVDGSSVGDLVDYLKIPRSKFGLVSVGGMPVKADTKPADRDCVRVFQPIAGG